MNGNKATPDINQQGTKAAEGVLRFKNIWRLLAYLFILVIIVLSLIPDPDKLTPFSASDKLMHALFYAVSMFWFGLCFKRERLFGIGTGLILLGIVLELIQGQTGYRTMSLYDIIANCAGVLIGLAISFSRLSKSLQYIEQWFLK
jgi:VanZ family protein